jgi:hypothetical protein
MKGGSPCAHPIHTNRLPDPDQQHALCHNAVCVVKMQHAQAGLQAVEAEACPSREVVAEALVVHDFESAGHRVSMLVLLDATIRARYCLVITKEVKWTEKTADGVRYAYMLGRRWLVAFAR